MKHSNLAVFLPHAGCPHQCSFCNQQTISGVQKPPSPQEVERILQTAVGALKNPSQTEIAFFGGTFTQLPESDQEAYLGIAQKFVREHRLCGIRISTRPDAVDEHIIERLCRYGVTAAELGAQSMEDQVLSLNRRGHTAEDVRRASGLIHGAGISLGLQMMTGLYGDTPETCRESAEAMAGLHPETVRIYPTVVLPGTALAHWQETGGYQAPGVEESVPLCADLLDFFESREIRVIKLGLHAEAAVAQAMIGGCYHPAFRELCESERYYRRAAEGKPEILSGRYILLVAPGECSKMTGQRRATLLKLEQLFSVHLSVREFAGVPKGIVLWEPVI